MTYISCNNHFNQLTLESKQEYLRSTQELANSARAVLYPGLAGLAYLAFGGDIQLHDMSIKQAVDTGVLMLSGGLTGLGLGLMAAAHGARRILKNDIKELEKILE